MQYLLLNQQTYTKYTNCPGIIPVNFCFCESFFRYRTKGSSTLLVRGRSQSISLTDNLFHDGVVVAAAVDSIRQSSYREALWFSKKKTF